MSKAVLHATQLASSLILIARYWNFPEFLSFLSIVFIVTVTLILVFKKEKDNEDYVVQERAESNLTITGTYVLLWKILKIRSMQLVGLFLLTRLVSHALNSFWPT